MAYILTLQDKMIDFGIFIVRSDLIFYTQSSILHDFFHTVLYDDRMA